MCQPPPQGPRSHSGGYVPRGTTSYALTLDPSGRSTSACSANRTSVTRAPKQIKRPVRLSKRSTTSINAASTRTARVVITHASPAVRCSKRPSCTTVCCRPRVRTASRRNAHFLARDSTIVSLPEGTATRSGIAGDPPPVPRSIQELSASGMIGAASSGSTTSLSSAAGPIAGMRGTAVKLIVAFHRLSRFMYSARADTWLFSSSIR